MKLNIGYDTKKGFSYSAFDCEKSEDVLTSVGGMIYGLAAVYEGLRQKNDSEDSYLPVDVFLKTLADKAVNQKDFKTLVEKASQE